MAHYFYGDDYQYAATRLCGSIVRKDRLPIYIHSISPNGDCEYSYLNNFLGVKMGHFDEINVDPIPLGYVNCKTNSIYCFRDPARKYKQGLSSSVFRILNVRANISWKSPYLSKTIAGNYPTPEKCLEEVECGETSMKAFSRFFAVGEKLKEGYALFKKDLFIGLAKYNENTEKCFFELEDKFNFLKEELEETINAKK
jgi:hypothetical protein